MPDCISSGVICATSSRMSRSIAASVSPSGVSEMILLAMCRSLTMSLRCLSASIASFFASPSGTSPCASLSMRSSSSPFVPSAALPRSPSVMNVSLPSFEMSPQPFFLIHPRAIWTSSAFSFPLSFSSASDTLPPYSSASSPIVTRSGSGFDAASGRLRV